MKALVAPIVIVQSVLLHCYIQQPNAFHIRQSDNKENQTMFYKCICVAVIQSIDVVLG